jgi:Immunity protein 35
MNFSQATIMAKEVVLSFSKDVGIDLMISEDQTIEGELGWMFFYNTADFIRYGRVSDALAGNGPIIVFRDGRVEEISSFVSIEDACKFIEAKYRPY